MGTNVVLFGWSRSNPGRERLSAAHFEEFVKYLNGRKQTGAIEDFDIVFLDPHGGDLGGFFLAHGSAEQCAALQNDEEFRRAAVDASLIVENFGVVPAATGEGVGPEMAMYGEAVGKLG